MGCLFGRTNGVILTQGGGSETVSEAMMDKMGLCRRTMAYVNEQW